LSQSIGQLMFFGPVQGLTTGAGIVVSRAVVRDMFAPARRSGDEPDHHLLWRRPGGGADDGRRACLNIWAGTACSGF
jgi:hypothetical protein